MIQKGNSSSEIYQSILIITMFIAGLLNSQYYFEFMGLSRVYNGLLLFFYSLLFFLGFITFINYMKFKVRISFPYWSILVVGVFLKFILMFIQFPSSFLPGNKYFYQVITYSVIFLVMIVLVRNIHTVTFLKKVILSFGAGASFSAILPLVFFPEMVGTRETFVGGYKFIGSFWNPSVISLMSVGWLILALYNIERTKWKRILLLILFALLLIGGLSGLSRSTLLAITVSVFVYLIISNKFLQYLKWGVFIIIFMLLIGVVFPEAVQNFEERLEVMEIKDEPRINIWFDYLEDIPEYILFGALDGNHLSYSATGHSPHSMLLNWLVQFGIISLIGVIILFLGVIISIRNIQKNTSRNLAACLYAWLAFYLSIALINETGFNEMTVFAAIGIIIAWGNLNKYKYVSQKNKDIEINLKREV